MSNYHSCYVIIKQNVYRYLKISKQNVVHKIMPHSPAALWVRKSCRREYIVAVFRQTATHFWQRRLRVLKIPIFFSWIYPK